MYYFIIRVVYYVCECKIEIVLVERPSNERRLYMWNVLKDISLLSFGAFIGVVLMCLLHVNR